MTIKNYCDVQAFKNSHFLFTLTSSDMDKFLQSEENNFLLSHCCSKCYQ